MYSNIPFISNPLDKRLDGSKKNKDESNNYTIYNYTLNTGYEYKGPKTN